MPLSVEEVRKIAKLARIKLTSDEEKRHAATISAVLDYMKILNEVDTRGVEQTSQVTGLEDVVRQDMPRDCKIIKELTAQMPEVENNELVVPGVFMDQSEDN
jgi:aspartyl-tRNA(Asn)/glutamyl-tRNA(Gln) amidotransferase subunit C